MMNNSTEIFSFHVRIFTQNCNSNCGEEMICRQLINTAIMAHILLFSICLTAPLLLVEKIDHTLRKKTVYLYRYVSSSIRMNRLDWIHTFSPTDGVYGVLYRMHVLWRH
mmetsp:Transcript_9794/g.9484  ORF Transcript_9794/g.9484 Transcript_9794/m.9484 type:complete len:109 (+) Transcript_9794:127-453(+)